MANRYMRKLHVIREMQIEATTRFHLTPVRMAVIKKQKSVGEDVAKKKPLSTIGENVNWYCNYGKQNEDSSKIKNKSAM